jgi:predicted choloylglycine hydrolase
MKLNQLHLVNLKWFNRSIKKNMRMNFKSYDLDENPDRFKELCDIFWPGYKNWFLSEGPTNRPGYTTTFKMLKQHMPEIVPIFESLCELGGGEDLFARFLGLYNPPAFIKGCSQLTWGDHHLIRNYDFHPHLFEASIIKTNWNKKVIAMSDCIWGVLDGINENGLAVSLAFGGQEESGTGFGIPLILRYILETCETTAEARAILKRVPTHMAYSVLVVDGNNDYTNAFLSPDVETIFVTSPCATNHFKKVTWPEYEKKAKSLNRLNHLKKILTVKSEKMKASRSSQSGKIPNIHSGKVPSSALDFNPLKKESPSTAVESEQEVINQMVNEFLSAPLFSTDYQEGFGTLYTSVYDTIEKSVKFIWPGESMSFQMDDFSESSIIIEFKKN